MNEEQISDLADRIADETAAPSQWTEAYGTALAAIKATLTFIAVPETGWKLVPIEPTDAMAAAAIGASLKEPEVLNGLPQYAAMLAAAPSPEASK